MREQLWTLHGSRRRETRLLTMRLLLKKKHLMLRRPFPKGRLEG
jgi:hypothetical protein